MAVARAAPADGGETKHRITDDRDVRWMLGLAVLAFVLRLWFVLAVEREQLPLDDTLFYHTIASQLADGNGFSLISGEPTAAWPPVWPFLLSLMYRVFGSDPIAGEVLNAFIGAATVPLLYWVARRALGRREAIFAGTAMALIPGQIFWNDVLLSETLWTFMVVGFLALMIALPDRRASWAAIGVALGIGALTRGEGLFLIVIPIAMAWRLLPRRELAIRTAIAIAVAALCIIPWTARNASSLDSFVPVSNNFAGTFWSGHNPKAHGGPTYPPAELIAPAERLPQPQRELERSRILRKDAKDWMLAHPLEEIGLVPKKLISLVRGDSQAFNLWINPTADKRVIAAQTQTRLAVAADAAWYALLTLTVLSILTFGKTLWRNRYLLGCIAFICVGLVLYGFLFYGNFRYRIAHEPLMLLIAAPLVTRLRLLRRPIPTQAESRA